MKDDNEELANQDSARSSILVNKDEITEEDDSKIPKKFPKKDLIIIISLVAAVLVVFAGVTLFALLRGNKEKVDQEFSVTIEVFGEKKGFGEKEHEKPNLNKWVYFISEDFKCDENDFKIYLNGSETKFSKKFIFDKEGNYTMTFKFSKEFESLENLFKNCYYITKITFTKINGNKLNDISNMFYNCDGLYEINLAGLDIKNVKKVNQMFFGCTSLISLDLSMLSFSNTEDMQDLVNAIIKSNQNLKDSSKNGDWKLYGEDMQTLTNLIDQLQKLVEKQQKEAEEEAEDSNSIMENQVITNVTNTQM